jgi:hypothetical protein
MTKKELYSFLKTTSKDPDKEIITLEKTSKLLKLNEKMIENFKTEKIFSGIGNANADIMFLFGEIDVDKILIMERLLEKAFKIKMSTVYMTNFWKIVKKSKEIKPLAFYLKKEVETIQPKIVIIFNEKLAEIYKRLNLNIDFIICPGLETLIEMESNPDNYSVEDIKKEQLNILKALSDLKKINAKNK